MYLVIVTKNKEHEFMHFINLEKTEVEKDINSLFNHLNYFKGQEIEKVYFSKDRLSNW